MGNSEENKKENNIKNSDLPKNKNNINILDRVISENCPIDDQNPIILSKGIYFNKFNCLEKKRNRDAKKSKLPKIKEQKLKKNNDKNKKILIKENNKENIEKKQIKGKEEKEDFLSISDKIIKSNIEKNKIHNEQNLKDNKEYIENCLKIIQIKDEKKYEQISKQYDKILRENNIFFEKIKNVINSYNSNIEGNNNTYSYECLTNNLYVKGIEGINQLSIILNIKNNGIFDWPQDNIFLLCDKEKSDIIAEDIQLISLKSQMAYSVNLIFKYLNLVFPGKHNSYLNLNINGKKYGKELKIVVEIIKKGNTTKI